MSGSIREWVVAILPWMTIALLVLWVPPVLFAVAVDVGLVAGRDYPQLRDPSLVLPIVELTLMTIAVPRLVGRSRSGWVLLAWSRIVVLLQTLWTILVLTRLEGLSHTLRIRSVVEALLGLAVAAVLLLWIRPAYAVTRTAV